jgi:LPS-assembly lipoprotein
MIKVMKLPALAVLTAVMFLVSACGFRPLYGEHSPGVSAGSELASIQLRTLNNRIDYLVRTNLIEKLQLSNAEGLPKYELALNLESDREGAAIEPDTTITRFNYTLRAKYDLIDLASRKTIYQGASRSIAAYNVVDDQFATLAARRNAQERTALDISDDIKLKLAIFFDRQENATTP